MSLITDARQIWNALPPRLRSFWESFFLRYSAYAGSTLDWYGVPLHAKTPFHLFYCHWAYVSSYFPMLDPRLPLWEPAFIWDAPDPTLQVGFGPWDQQFNQWTTLALLFGEPPLPPLKIPRHTRIGVSRHRTNLP